MESMAHPLLSFALIENSLVSLLTVAEHQQDNPCDGQRLLPSHVQL
jgi:hypothetical protein